LLVTSAVLGDAVAENRGADFVERLVPSPCARTTNWRGSFELSERLRDVPLRRRGEYQAVDREPTAQSWKPPKILMRVPERLLLRYVRSPV